ncbi:Sodium:neurotransmitter symporter, partial [Trinorchestia longiramus]
MRRYVTHEAKSWEAGLGLPDWKLTLCLAASWLVLFLTLVKGVQSAGKTAYFTALFPYVVLFTLLGRGVTLPGAYDGIMYFLTPQWEKLLDGNVWYQAVTQSFFSLSVAFGSISMFSSYNDFKHNVYRDSLIISFMDTATSLLAGLTIFSVLGNLKYEIQADSIDDVVQGGAGLAFITYPTAIAKFNYVPQ